MRPLFRKRPFPLLLIARYALFATVLLCFVSAPVKAQRPFRISFGGDSSSFGQPGSESRGAIRLGLAYDVWRSPQDDLTVFAFYDRQTNIFNDFYGGFGAGFRRRITNVGGDGHFYISPVLGLYTFNDLNETSPGLRLAVGYQSSGAVFTEVTLTLIGVEDYEARPAVMFGLRL